MSINMYNKLESSLVRFLFFPISCGVQIDCHYLVTVCDSINCTGVYAHKEIIIISEMNDNNIHNKDLNI